MKTLVVFYSRTGTTKKVAEKIAGKLGADVEELVDTKNRAGVLNYLPAGRDAIKKTLTKIEEVKFNPSDYDLVIVGTPIWVGTITPAVRTYLTEQKNRVKKIAAFCTKGGSGKTKIFTEIEDSFGLAPISTMELRTKEVVKEPYEDAVNGFLTPLK